jgi:hypothetical protein
VRPQLSRLLGSACSELQANAGFPSVTPQIQLHQTDNHYLLGTSKGWINGTHYLCSQETQGCIGLRRVNRNHILRLQQDIFSRQAPQARISTKPRRADQIKPLGETRAP